MTPADKAALRARGVLIVDKAQGPSSHDVVRLARRAFGLRAVGHAGTLDPMASGVLVLGLGEGTKLLNHLSGDDKAYRATVKLGAATDSLDAMGAIVEEQPVPAGLERAHVQAIANRFLGDTIQRAPVISAIKQGGEPLYARARRGEAVIAPERPVRIHRLEIVRAFADTIELEVHSAKGFYVRALARDLAAALGTVGHLSALRRTLSGAFTDTEAVPMTLLTAAASGDAAARELLRGRLLTLTAALRGCPRVTATGEGADDIRHGRALVLERVCEGSLPAEGSDPVAILDAAGELIALGRAGADRISVVRGFPREA
jgi:tRNA pseudouridine55 synthase